MNFFLSFKRRIRAWLYTPGRERLLAIVGTMYTVIRTKKPCVVFPVHGVWVHRYRDGSVVDRHINPSLSLAAYDRLVRDYWFHVYEPRDGDMIIDVGAGKGEETYTFSRSVGPRGQVIAIGAHPQTFACLAALCHYNDLRNVTPLCAAIGDREGEMTIDNPDSDIMSSVTGEGDGYRVAAHTLDWIAATYGVRKIDFLKMNIEGAERLALLGMTEAINNVRYACISCHDFLATSRHDETLRTKETVKKFFLDQGFRVITRDDDQRPYIQNQIHAINLNIHAHRHH